MRIELYHETSLGGRFTRLIGQLIALFVGIKLVRIVMGDIVFFRP